MVSNLDHWILGIAWFLALKLYSYTSGCDLAESKNTDHILVIVIGRWYPVKEATILSQNPSIEYPIFDIQFSILKCFD